MQEFTTPGEIEIADDANVTDLMWENERDHPDHVVFTKRSGASFTDPVTSAQFATEVRRLAAGLIDAGVGIGDRVALMSKTRYEWVLCDFAIWTAGAVTVPVYETSSAEQVEWILRDSGAVGIFVESPAHASLVESARGADSPCKLIWEIDSGALETLSRDVDPADAALTARHRAAGKDDLATIIYTSGTTGRPKGCELTHANLLYETYATGISFGDFLNASGSLLLFVPLAHVLGRATQLTCFHARTRVGHSPDIKNLVAELAEFKPTFLLAVPRVFEKIYNGSKQKAHADPKTGFIFDKAEGIAIAYSEALDRGGAGLALRAQHAVFDKLVYSKLKHALGGQVKHCVSGGAPLGSRLGHFFRGIGVTILEGYGLTETSAGITSNSTGELKIGSVGRPMVGDSIRIAADGEVLLRGGQVFRGYFNNPAATAEAFTDGWFRTGDIGQLDNEGYLTITGRKKEILVTAGGKNVAPAVLEDRLRAHALVSQCMVVGDGKPFVGALVTIDADALRAWRKQRGQDETVAVADLVDDEQLRAEIQAAVDDANKAVSAAEAIKVFKILPVDFTEEGGQMTPSLKLKRSVVMQEFATDVEAIYR